MQDFFEDFARCAEENRLGVYGIHLYREGLPPQSRRFREDERVHLYSGSKTFTSLAVGMAEAEGLLRLEQPALSFFPEYRALAAAGSEEIRVIDLLQMRAGHEESLFTTDEATHSYEADWAELFFQRPMKWPAGTRYVYDNGASYMLSRVVEKVSGCTLRNYLVPRLFTPLGIRNPQWHTCPRGHSLGAVGLYLKTEEFSRLGILLLQGGAWQGAQLAAKDYVRRMYEDTAEVCGFDDAENNLGYGYQVWRCSIPGVFRADGKFGQYSIVFPELRAVVAVTAHNENSANDILRAVWRHVLPALR